MKRIFVLVVSLLSFVSFAEAGVSLGIKFSPAFAFSRVSPSTYDDNGTAYVYGGDGVKMRFGVGVMVDYMIGKNYGISTGLNFLLNGSGYKVTKSVGNNSILESNPYSIQFVQIPLMLKLQTGEILDNTSFYFKTGASIDYMIGARVRGEKSVQLQGSNSVVQTTDYINALHSSLLFSPGVEIKWKGDIIFMLGVTYSRGITDSDNQDKNTQSKITGFEMFNDFIAIDLGVKF